MKAVRWVTFSNPTRQNGTIFHFLPATPGAATPYPVEMAFTIYGRAIKRVRKVIEGARLFHPDGVMLESLFAIEPGTADTICGVELEIYCNQVRADVSSSQCLVEYLDHELPIKYIPRKIVIDSDSKVHSSAKKVIANKGGVEQVESDQSDDIQCASQTGTTHLIMKDAMISPSIVIVNGSENEIRPDVYSIEDRHGEKSRSLLPLGQVSASSVIERKIEGALLANVTPQEMSWGLMRSITICASYDRSSAVAYYLVYRDTKSNDITSVISL